MENNDEYRQQPYTHKTIHQYSVLQRLYVLYFQSIYALINLFVKYKYFFNYQGDSRFINAVFNFFYHFLLQFLLTQN